MSVLKNVTKGLESILFQLIPVAVGVYIGILAGNWNDARHAKENQEQFLKTLALELEENQKNLQEAAVYHQQVGLSIDSVQAIFGQEDLEQPIFNSGSFNGFISNWRGIKIPRLERSIYETGIVANALVNLEFETINKISKIYGLQESYRTFSEPILNRLLNMDMNTTRQEAILILTFITTDLNSMEFSLVNAYDQLLEYLEERQ